MRTLVKLACLASAILAASVFAACGATNTPTSNSSSATSTVALRTAQASCQFDGSGLSSAPDRTPGCTPGMWVSDPAIKSTPAASEYDPEVSDAHVCSHGYNPRPGVEVSGPLKDEALKEYGLPLSEASTREADHLYPRWLGGATVLQNFWPEPNYTHPSGYENNPKDALEYAVYKLTCQQHKLTVAEARAIFEGDWRPAYSKYVGGPIQDKALPGVAGVALGADR